MDSNELRAQVHDDVKIYIYSHFLAIKTSYLDKMSVSDIKWANLMEILIVENE